MKSKNAKPLTKAERAHIERVKGLPCSLLDTPPPSSAHHIKQGQHFTTVALSWEAHQGPNGWHGNKSLWRIRKMDELDALAVTIGRLME
jgi:hypothetical protein